MQSGLPAASNIDTSPVINWRIGIISPNSSVIKHCTQCGAIVSHQIPDGDTLPRAVCPDCAHIQYENPRLVVGCLASHGGKILICRRAIEPGYGLWTLPAGFMENGESTAQGAARETQEEAGAKVHDLTLFAMVNIPHINQVHLFYRGKLPTPEFAAGDESLEVALVALDDIPWATLAFHSVRFCLERYREDLSRGHFGVHETTLFPSQTHQSSSSEN